MIAAAAFLLGILGSLFVAEASLADRLMMAFLPAGMAFIATLMLFARDHWRHAATMRSVRRMLLDRALVDDAEHLAHSPDADPTLIAQTRQAVSEFFNVPVQRIRLTDDLRNDLKFEALEPCFHSFVVLHVLTARNIEPPSFTFDTSDLADVSDLAREIQRVLDGCAQGKSRETRPAPDESPE